eukprot:CAMPEP_0119414144 /NCGR_PEP_ID=MMETSP1335-20130426/6549_1 /TAXON_ID=259385 /ORGANISM="Chrysoculter rhomboideus, Strain RCC1486" /LENGTH=115 /DNA_ID=CAMNT_0007438999 /DNA_START=481 /DNA_END=825 /DNA_ORIENTATION=-
MEEEGVDREECAEDEKGAGLLERVEVVRDASARRARKEAGKRADRVHVRRHLRANAKGLRRRVLVAAMRTWLDDTAERATSGRAPAGAYADAVAARHESATSVRKADMTTGGVLR